MRKIIVCMLTGLLLVACNQREGLEPKLDGMWQLQNLDSVYYSFQVNVVQVRRIGQTSGFGFYEREGDSLRFALRKLSLKQLKSVGLTDSLPRFRVETLTGSRLVLRSDSSELVFKKY